MEFKYVRIQGRELSYVTKYPKGIFAMCWRKIYDGVYTNFVGDIVYEDAYQVAVRV